jgi:hypothetical protein
MQKITYVQVFAAINVVLRGGRGGGARLIAYHVQ